MLTIEEVKKIPLFSTLGDSELERLVRTSADLHLNAGEFAVPEGGERALFAVLSGKIQVIKTFDGVERVLGFRLPGTVFGEVPMAFGTPFPGGYRAVEPSRVMRVEPQQYYAVASAAPEVAMKLGKLASERIAGLQNITAEVPKTQVTMFGPRFDPACGEMRRFLARNQISHVWTTPESPDIASLGEQNCPPHTEWPVLRLV
ncbi:MAG: Crp/Fnr family transcriptional regulator, partial [Betaproteobacteria bacterium]